MVGQTISHYKILEKLGEGGMGVVYKAEDLKLQRAVALKILPREALVTEQDRMRFAREAQTAASLNHPNIAMIHEFDEVEDPTTHGQIAFIAMEFVDGETLKQKVKDHPLPIKEVLSIAIAVAEGLTKAHEKEIIHRDVKSDNVMISNDGVVKITDFGLAEIPGRTRVTKEGTTVGTIAYMSPEQALGEKLDRRTDIWSLGVVLYEIITGRLPFAGDYEQAIVYKILNEESEPITSLRSNVPMELEHIVTKALMKDREERYQHSDEILADLRVLNRSLGSSAASGVVSRRSMAGFGTQQPSRLVKPPLARRENLIWISLSTFFFLSTLFLLLFRPFGKRETKMGTILATILPPSSTSYSQTVGGNLALSPDGQKLAFVADDGAGGKLWVRSLNAAYGQPLNGTEEAHSPFWSPDSRHLGFFAQGKLKRIELAAGSPVTVAEAPNGRGGTWGNDGTIVFAPDASGGLYRVSATGGIPAPVTTLDSTRHELTHRWPYFLPDGMNFLYIAFVAAGSKVNAIYVASVDSKINRLLFPSQSNAQYANGLLLYLQQTTLMARPFDVKSLSLHGEGVTVAEGLQFEPNFAKGDFTVSQNGILAYRAGGLQSLLDLSLIDRGGREIQQVLNFSPLGNARLAPSGESIAYQLYDAQTKSSEIWIQELARGTRTKIAFGKAMSRSPVWSPDGKNIAYSSDRRDPPHLDLYLRAVQSASTDEILTKEEHEGIPTDWSPDGRMIFCAVHVDAVRKRDLLLLPLSGNREPIAFLRTEFDEWDAHFSPDMQWVAYVSDETGKPEIYVRALKGGGGKVQVSSGSGTDPRWNPASHELFYVQGNRVMGAEVESTLKGFKVRGVNQIIEIRSASEVSLQDVSADGKRFLVTTRAKESTSSPATLMVNWAAE
jgi:serine/threonine protein kinase